MKNIRTSGHFVAVLDSNYQKVTVDESVRLLSHVDFDTLVFIGLSGAVLAPIIAYKMGKEMLMVRKNGGNDRSNSARWLEGNHAAEKVIVVDDLISSGRTMAQVMHALRWLQSTENPDMKIVELLLHCIFNPTVSEYRPSLHLPSIDDFYFHHMIASERDWPSPRPDLSPNRDGLPNLY